MQYLGSRAGSTCSKAGIVPLCIPSRSSFIDKQIFSFSCIALSTGCFLDAVTAENMTTEALGALRANQNDDLHLRVIGVLVILVVSAAAATKHGCTADLDGFVDFSCWCSAARTAETEAR